MAGGVDDCSMAMTGSGKRVWATMGFAMVSNEGDGVIARTVTLLEEIRARNGGHWDDECAHSVHSSGEEK